MLNYMKDVFTFHKTISKLKKSTSFYKELTTILVKEIAIYDVSCEKLASLFATHFFSENSINCLPYDEAIDVSCNFFALITSSFTEDMDFSNTQWEFIKVCVGMCQGEISIEVLNNILNAMVERKRL